MRATLLDGGPSIAAFGFSGLALLAGDVSMSFGGGDTGQLRIWYGRNSGPRSGRKNRGPGVTAAGEGMPRRIDDIKSPPPSQSGGR